jgi:hypothetical protein
MTDEESDKRFEKWFSSFTWGGSCTKDEIKDICKVSWDQAIKACSGRHNCWHCRGNY